MAQKKALNFHSGLFPITINKYIMKLTGHKEPEHIAIMLCIMNRVIMYSRNHHFVFS